MSMRTLLLRIINLLLRRNGWEQFKHDLGMSESGCNYGIKNTLGYLGKYQFGMMRLCDAGITIKTSAGYEWAPGYSEAEFLADGELQERLFLWHVKDLARLVQLHYGEYIGKRVNGALITLSGLVAGAHLGGLGGVRLFLTGADATDAYGGTVSNYIKLFAGYDLSEVL